MPLEIGCVKRNDPQVDSGTERSCRETRCFLIRAPAGLLKQAARRYLAGPADALRAGAFTLVEVVIAVGLVAFVLTAILGLVTIAANETKNADLKARLTWITEEMTSEFQSQRFSSALASVPTNGSASFYWDYSGMRLTNSNGAYFVCDVSNVTPTNTPNYPTNYLALLQVSIRWPSPQLTSTNASVISLFNSSRGLVRMVGAFSLLALLVATAVFVGLALVLVSIAGSVSSFWQMGISHNERRSSALAAFSRMTRDLRFAAAPINPNSTNFQLVINPTNSAPATNFPKPRFGRRRWPAIVRMATWRWWDILCSGLPRRTDRCRSFAGS